MSRQDRLRFEAVDYYATLHLTVAASPAQVKKSYKQMALKWHPDKHVEGSYKEYVTDMFQRVNEAHEVLSNPEKRAEYDTVWHEKHSQIPATARTSQGKHTTVGAAAPRSKSTSTNTRDKHAATGTARDKHAATGTARDKPAATGTARDKPAATRGSGARQASKSSGRDPFSREMPEEPEMPRKPRMPYHTPYRSCWRSNPFAREDDDRPGPRAPFGNYSEPCRGWRSTKQPERDQNPAEDAAPTLAELRRQRVKEEMKREQDARRGEWRDHWQKAEAERSKAQPKQAAPPKEDSSSSSSSSEDEVHIQRPVRRAATAREQANKTDFPFRRTQSAQEDRRKCYEAWREKQFRGMDAWVEDLAKEKLPRSKDRESPEEAFREYLRKTDRVQMYLSAALSEGLSEPPDQRSPPAGAFSEGRQIDRKAPGKPQTPPSRRTWNVNLHEEGEENWMRQSSSLSEATRSPSDQSAKSTQSAGSWDAWNVEDFSQYVAEATYSRTSDAMAAARETVGQVGEGISAAVGALNSFGTALHPSNWFGKVFRGAEPVVGAPRTCALCGQLLKGTGGQVCRSCYSS